MDSQKRVSVGKNIINSAGNNSDKDIIINSYPEDFVPQFAVLMPVHNEENSITDVVTEVYDKLVKNSTCPIEIILSEDGSKDDTKDVIINLSRKIPLKASLSYIRKGYAGGIKEGLKLVVAPYVIISDSDGQLRPEDFWLLKDRLDKIASPNKVIISGRRKIRADDLHRRVISKTFQKLNSVVFDLDSIKDITSPFKLMATDLAKRIASDCKYMNESFWTEFVVRACSKNIKIVEVQVQHSKRLKDETVVYKKSKIPKIIINQLFGLVKLKRDIAQRGFVSSLFQTKSVRRFITFVLVGSSGAGITLFLTWLGVNLHLHYLLSAAIAIEISIGWAFLLNDRITFRDKIDNYQKSKTLFRFLKYNASSLGGEAINISTLFLLTSAGMFYLYSEAVAILVAFMWNYTLSRKWVWDNTKFST
jgi:dolichol-phosphate mannosyltransferase